MTNSATCRGSLRSEKAARGTRTAALCCMLAAATACGQREGGSVPGEPHGPTPDVVHEDPPPAEEQPGARPTGSESATEEDTEEGIAAASQWLSLVDQAEYGASWDGASEYFRSAVPKATWEAQMQGVRAPLGAVRSREVTSAQFATELPGAPDGAYVVVQFRSSFERKDTAVETVTPMRDPDGVFRVSGYFIR